MTRAIRHGFVKDDSGSVGALHAEDHETISQHLRNHVHLTNCIHLKNHMHRHSPIQAERSLMRDLVVLQRSKSLRDPSTSPPPFLSPFVIATLVKRSGKDAGVQNGRRSIGVDVVGEVNRLSVNHPKAAVLSSYNVTAVGTSGDHSAGKECRDEELRKGEDGSRFKQGEKASHSNLVNNPRLKTLSEQLEEIPSQSDNEIRKPPLQSQHRGRRGGGDKRSKDFKTSGFSRTKRRKSRGLRRTHGSVDLRGGRVHNDMSVASTSLAHHKCFLGEEEEDQENGEVDVTQAPSHGCGIPWNWSRIHHRGKTFLDIAGRSLSCGLSESSLRKDGGSVQQSLKEKDNSRLPVTSQLLTSSTGSDSEALPFLLDPSGSPEEARSGNQHSSRGYCRRRHQNLTQKYMPKTFKDLVGQSLVVQALSNAVLRRKVGLIYVFYGPHGTGKTSCAHVFAKALNCQSTEHSKPCDVCTSCMSHNLRKSRNLVEVEAVSTFDTGRITDALNNVMLSTSTSQYKVFIVDVCDNLPPDFWMAITKVAHHAPRHVVFILISSSLDHLPHQIISRCQKFYFPKVKESDIIITLQQISTNEGLEIDKDALKLIASRSDGSLRDAEMTLDQLSLLGQRISLPLVQELVGLVSDEKLVDLLDVALSANTVDTIKNLREIIEAGVEPIALMSQLATLITDILAGSHVFTRERPRRKFFHRQTISKEDMEKLRQALRTLSEAEKNLRLSNDKLTWVTAALLQIIPDQQYAPRSSIDAHSSHTPLLINGTDKQIEARNAINGEDEACYSEDEIKRNLGVDSLRHKGLKNAMKANIKSPNGKDDSIRENLSSNFGRRWRDYGKIWEEVIENVQSDALKQFLCQEGRLNSIRTGSAAAPIVQLVFMSPASKSKAEKFRGQILQALEFVFRTSVILEIRCYPRIDARQGARVFDDLDEPNNISSRMTAIQHSISNHNSHSPQSESLLRRMPHENAQRGSGSRLADELQFDYLAMERDRKGKGPECVKAGVGSSSQKHEDSANLCGRMGYEERNHSKSLVKGKVSLAHVIQQAEGCANHGGWSKQRAISIAEKLEQENMRLESRSRSLLCWKVPRVARSKFVLSRKKTKNPRSLLKLITCSRCLSSRSAR
ncbi:protein STICHEL-like 3 isoform X2 [Phalaenopsis equestris]|uniref:protein STICHEL-like 3 isoform X2 n=1 Tax=Phalaenopsis equestris TaxID=78828 RepID=UPI0009E2737F|nr:protein STICHEL-like 3 isoform X2 [Phalaenopsis equestris]